MNRLTKKQQAELERRCQEVNDAAAEYEAKRADLNAYLEELHEAACEYFDGRSERWQDSERGNAHQDWAGSFTNEAGEEAVEVDASEYPAEPEAV